MTISATIGLPKNLTDPLSVTLTAMQTVGTNLASIPSISSPLLLPPSASEPVSQEIVFVDPGVPDYQILLDGIGRNVEVIILDAKKEGIAQITDVLAEQENLSAIHIISHGGPGSLQLGSTSLSFSNLSDHSKKLQGWAKALTPEADILLYGCDVAAGAQGDAFIQQLSQLTGADVAASVDKTGDVGLGGDWQLEARTSVIEAGLIVNPERGSGYHYLLSVPTFSSANYTVGSYPRSVTTADMNGDGKADVLTANYGSNTVSLLLGNGNGTFQTKVDYSVGSSPASVTTADVNGDGKADVLAANYSSSSLSLLLGNGDGTLQTKVDYTVGGYPYSVTTADMNGDGKADVLSVNGISNIVSLLLGNGDGTLQTKGSPTVGTNPLSVTTADVNGDGKADVLAANTTSNTVSLLLGNGNGTFQTRVNYAVGITPYSVTTADMNGDSKVDVLTANQSSNTVSLLLGNGDGTFQTKVDYAVGSGPLSVTTADVNGDGKADVLTANLNSDTVSLLLGNGDGTFQTKVDYAVGTSSYSVTTADVNGDGKADVLVANLGSNTVSVLLNTTAFSINTMSSVQIAALSGTQLDSLTSVELAALANTQLNGLTSTQLSGLANTQLDGLTSLGLFSLANTQLDGLTSVALTSLMATQLDGLTSVALTSLMATQLDGLTSVALTSLMATQLDGLTSVALTSLMATQLDGLTSVSLTSLAATQLDGLTSVSLTSLMATQLDGLTSVSLTSLAATQLDGLTSVQLTSLSNTQLDGITSTQLTALADTQLDGFTSSQLAALTTTQIAGFTTTQLAGLTTTQIAGLTVATAPPSNLPIDNGGSQSFTEHASAVQVSGTVTTNTGTVYGDGYLNFAISNSGTSETLALPTVGTASITVGAISVVGSTVYLGDGTTANLIGQVDSTLDGTAGKGLRVNFASTLSNAGFETGNTTGWTINNKLVVLGVADEATSRGISYSSSVVPSSSSSPSSSYSPLLGNSVLRLFSSGSIYFTNRGSNYGHIFGPEAISTAFNAKAGDSLSVDWSAIGGGDSYDVYGFLVNTATGAQTELFHRVDLKSNWQPQPWTTSTGSIPTDGNYQFRFVSGTYDATGGKVVGASLFIDNARLISGAVNDAVVQQLARMVTYDNASHSPTTTRTVTISAKPITGSVNTTTATINITAVNDIPTLSSAPTTWSYTEEDGVRVVASGLTLTDLDDQKLVSATVILDPTKAGFSATDEYLALVNSSAMTFNGGSNWTTWTAAVNGISLTYTRASGVLAATGSGNIADYQAIFRSVTYQNGQNYPTAADLAGKESRSITWQVTDANADGVGAATSTLATTAITLLNANEIPQVLNANGTIAYTEQATAATLGINLLAIGNGVLPDQLNLATVKITAGLTAGDLLTATTTGTSILSSYDATAGILTLSGVDATSTYQTVMRAIQFSGGDDPTVSSSNRTITWRVMDPLGVPSAVDAGATTLVHVTPVNDAPLVTNLPITGAIVWSEGGAGVTLAPSVTVSDVDDTQLTQAQVVLSGSGLVASKEYLTLANSTPTTGSMSANSNWTVANVNATGIAAQYVAATGTLTFTGTAPLATYQTLLRQVNYGSVDDNPTAISTTRSLTWTVTDANSDGVGAQTGSATSTITLQSLNSAPTLTNLPASPVAYTEGGSAVVLASGVTVADIDDATMESALVAIGAGFTAGDTLTATTTGTGITANYDADTGQLYLTGTATKAQYQTLLQSIRFSSSSDNPIAIARTRSIGWSITDAGSGGVGTETSAKGTMQVTLTPTGDAPIITTGAAVTYNQGAAATVVQSGITVSDPDDANIAGGAVTISTGLKSGDLLALPESFVTSSGISGVFANGVLTLSGTASVAQYEAALRAVTFATTDTSADTVSRTFTWSLRDADSNGVGAQTGSNTSTLSVLTGKTTQVSVDSTGNKANKSSDHPDISGDGRYVTFSSDASNLVAGDTNGVSDIFLRDTVTGQTTRLSVDAAGKQANEASDHAAISADGRFVTFSSLASNLVAGDTNRAADIFLKEIATGQITRLSVDSAGNQTHRYSDRPSISSDGRFVTFSSAAVDLEIGDSNDVSDIFLRDTWTNQTRRISVNSAGGQGNGASDNSVISADGWFVAYTSAASNLVEKDTNRVVDTFLYNTQTGQTTRISLSSAGKQGNLYSNYAPAISADGRFVVFLSHASNLVNGDTNGVQDIFLRDTRSGQTTRISDNSNGTQANLYAYYAPAISADGRFVSLLSHASNMVNGDTNGVSDIFLKDTQTDVTRRISVNTSGEQANQGSYSAQAISDDGRFVVFLSLANNLTADGTVGLRNIFLRETFVLPATTVPAMTAVPVVYANGLSNTQLGAMTTTQVRVLSPTQMATLTTTNMAALSTTQVRALTSAQIPALTTTQVGSLTTTWVRALSTIQAKSLTSTQIGLLSTTQMVGLTAAQITIFSTAQVRGLSAAQVAALTPAQSAGLTIAQMASLTVTQLGSLEATTLAAMGTAQIRGMTATQIGAMTTTQEQGLTITQIKLLTTAQMKGLTTTQIQNLSTIQVAGLTSAQIRSWTTTLLGGLESTDLSILSTTQLNGLSSQQVAALTTIQLDGLTSRQMGGLTTLQLKGLNATQIGSLETTQVAPLSSAQFKAFSTAQVGALTITQVATLTTTQLKGLSVQQMAALSTTQVTALGSASLRAKGTTAAKTLSAAQVGGLSTTQIVVLGTTLLKGLTVPHIRALTTTQMASMTTVQIASLTTVQVVALTVTQLGGLGAEAMAALTTNQVKSLTTGQIASLSSTQVGGLESTDIAQFSTAQMRGLSSGQLAVWSTTQMGGLSSKQIAALSTAQVGGVESVQIASLSTQQIKGLTTRLIMTLTTTQLGGFDVVDLAAFSVAQLKSLTTTQLRTLTTAQVGGLTTMQVRGLTSLQLSGLSTTQVGGMESTDIAALTVAQFKGFDTVQIGSFQTAQVAALTTALIRGLTTTQVGGLESTAIGLLSTAQVRSLSTAHMAVLTMPQIGGLTAQQITVLTNAQVQALSSESIAALTTAQFAGLSAIQIRALTASQVTSLAAKVTHISTTQLPGLEKGDFAIMGVSLFSTAQVNALSAIQKKAYLAAGGTIEVTI